MTISRSEIEAICQECGQEYALGCVYHRSLDAYDQAPEPYCIVCDSGDLKFLPPPKERKE